MKYYMSIYIPKTKGRFLLSVVNSVAIQIIFKQPRINFIEFQELFNYSFNF